MANIVEMTTEQLISYCVWLDKEAKKNKRMMDAYKAELQARGLDIMENQNIKYVKFYGSEGNCSIQDSMTLDLLNIDKLKDLIGEGVFKQKVKETTETKYKFDPKLEKALKAIFTGDYTFEFTLEEFMDQLSVEPDEKQRKLLLKRLKGDYKQDKATLLTVLGFMDRGQDEANIDAPSFDEELWYIYKIKNAELIQAFLPEEGIDIMMDQIRKCIIVESKTAIALDYEMED